MGQRIAYGNGQRQISRPWQQLHHWQGFMLVLLMLPLGSSLLLGSALLEQANRKGLPEATWAELEPEFRRWLGHNPGPFAPGVGSDTEPNVGLNIGPNAGSIARLHSTLSQLLPPKYRQRRTVRAEVSSLSRQMHKHLEVIIAPSPAPPPHHQ